MTFTSCFKKFQNYKWKFVPSNSSKGIDLIGDEFKPKQNGVHALNGHHTSYDLKDLDAATNGHHQHHIHNSSLNHTTTTSLSDMQAINVTGATAQTTNLGPNMVLVNSAGGTTQTAVPIQQIIQQAQQQQQLQQVQHFSDFKYTLSWHWAFQLELCLPNGSNGRPAIEYPSSLVWMKLRSEMYSLDTLEKKHSNF